MGIIAMLQAAFSAIILNSQRFIDAPEIQYVLNERAQSGTKMANICRPFLIMLYTT